MSGPEQTRRPGPRKANVRFFGTTFARIKRFVLTQRALGEVGIDLNDNHTDIILVYDVNQADISCISRGALPFGKLDPASGLEVSAFLVYKWVRTSRIYSLEDCRRTVQRPDRDKVVPGLPKDRFGSARAAFSADMDHNLIQLDHFQKQRQIEPQGPHQQICLDPVTLSAPTPSFSTTAW